MENTNTAYAAKPKSGRSTSDTSWQQLAAWSLAARAGAAAQAKRMIFFVCEGGQEHGPFTIPQLRDLAQKGLIHPGTRVRNIDLGFTNSARRIKDVFTEAQLAAFVAACGLQPMEVA